MRRALSSWTAVVLVLVGLLTPARAWAGKPQVAILGLEVVDPSGNVDARTTTVAKDLTDGLRARAKIGSGPYTIAPGSDKELIDEKLIKNCDSEGLACMSQIGKDLGADFLLYGKLEKTSDGYDVRLNLLNIAKRKMEKVKIPVRIPFSAIDQKSLAEAATKAYNDLVGVVETGTLVVTTNAQSGDVFLDDTKRGSLIGGSATINGLAEGRYRLAVEAQNYQRSEEVVVTIKSGETTPQQFTLASTVEFKTGTIGSSKKMNIAKPIFVVAMIGTLASTAYLVYEWQAIKPFTLKSGFNPPKDGILSENECSGDERKTYDGFTEFTDNCRHAKNTVYGWTGVGVFGAAFLISGYFAFIRGGDEAEPVNGTTVGSRKRRQPLKITPVITPSGGGATVQLDW